MPYTLLIVDDEPSNLRLLERTFRNDCRCLTATSGEAALRLVQQHDVAIMITDQRMPGMSGIDLCKATAGLRPHMVRILLTGYTDVEALVEAINCGLIYMYFTKPWNNEDLKLKVNRAGQHYENNKKRSALELENTRLGRQIANNNSAVVRSLIEIGRARNSKAHKHALRVCAHATAIARKLELANDALNELVNAALLHDLVGFESSQCRYHVDAQDQKKCELELLQSIPELGSVADVVRFQHENYDGSGFPTGLGKDQIPLVSRIIRVADECDLLLNPVSAPPMLRTEALQFLKQRAGKQFDPAVIEALLTLSPEEVENGMASLDTAYMFANGSAFVNATHGT